MRKFLITIFILLLLSTSYIFGFNSGLKNKSSSVISLSYKSVNLDSEILWSLIQTWRIENGLHAYIKNQELCKIAIDRSDDEFDYNNPHKGFIEKYHKGSYSISENLTGATSEKDALNRWLNSPLHRQALEKDFRFSCTATYKDLAVQIFSNLSP